MANLLATQDVGTTKRVIIVGAGFGGLSAAKALSDQKGVSVVLIDRQNYHLFQPLLYQVATAGLSPADIAVPIRAEFAKAENVEVHLAAVSKVDGQGKCVVVGDHCINYDYLILACGATHSYFGNSAWEEFAPGLKSLEQATEIRRRALLAFEKAESAASDVERARLLSFAVVGGGPTGVELAGALAEIAKQVMVRDFRHINPKDARIILLEAGPRILPMFDEKLSLRAQRDLESLGVEVRLNTRVTQIDAEGLCFGSERLYARTVIWAAGVQPSRLNQDLATPTDRLGRVQVNPDLSLPRHPEIFVVGDQANFQKPSGEALPGLAPVAIQQGRAAARNILRDLQGRERLRFEYIDKGQMATIGKRRAVMQFGKIRIGGALAWYAWLFVHLIFLVGFRNRVAVIAEWIWSYTFTRRSARLILGRDWRTTF